MDPGLLGPFHSAESDVLRRARRDGLHAHGAASVPRFGVLVYGFFQRRERRPSEPWRSFFSPLISFAVCLWIWLSVSRLAMMVGFAWLALGARYYLYLQRAGVNKQI